MQSRTQRPTNHANSSHKLWSLQGDSQCHVCPIGYAYRIDTLRITTVLTRYLLQQRSHVTEIITVQVPRDTAQIIPTTLAVGSS